MTVAYHIPGTIDVKTVKMIAVIPFPDGIIFFHKPVIFKHPSDLYIRKSKKFIILNILYCVYTKIIESGENTFL